MPSRHQGRPWLARRLADQIVAYSAAHFGGEEVLMEALEHPKRECHAGEDAELLAHMR